MNIYILYGQTATGKTAKALELAQKENGEIVNFDSRQIYTKLDIVTGKDKPLNSKFKISNLKLNDYCIGYYDFQTLGLSDFKSRIWLYDIVDPKIPFSSADYVSCAELVLIDILKRGKTPILVGGTGYYLYHLLYGVPKIEVPQDWELRNQLSQKTVEELQTMLKERDKALFESLNESDRANPRRLIRRIEILHLGGALPTKPTTITLPRRISDLVGRSIGTIKLELIPFFHVDSKDKELIIRNRVVNRIEEGAIEELQKLIKDGYSLKDPGLNAIGYKQIADYLEDRVTKEQMIEQWITKEMQYSKRQKTFFSKLFPSLTK